MASVTGITATRANEIYNASIVSGTIDSNGQLILKTRGGLDINAGPIISPTAAVDRAYPVGSIYMSTISTNPSVTLGTGTWIRWGQGRVPVGISDTDNDFNAVEKTGGEKTHHLTQAEMPQHNHGGITGRSYISASFAIKPVVSANPDTPAVAVRGTGTSATRSLQDSTHTHTISNQGGNAPHNNLQPYVVCYMWKRSA